MRVKYCGSAKDYSGYGEANRHDIASLLTVGLDVTAQIPVYTPEISDYGRIGDMVLACENKPISYKLKIIHTTPNVYRQYFEPNKYHIGRIFWETDRLPLDFSGNAQLVDEIWTGSEYNAQAIRNSGVTRPIYIIPEAIDTNIDIVDFEPYTINHTNDYKFYSIFEWTERKNPEALLTAFWTEFEDTEGVSLTIKCYLDNFNRKKRSEIDKDIKRIKKKLGLKRYAPVYLYRNLMDRRQVYRFHRTFDCFVSAHRGEGWGIPQMEALLLNNPIISTNCGGIHEYLTHKKHGLLIDYKKVQVSGNNRNVQWYTEDQNWAQIDVQGLAEAMRYAYENQSEMRKMGKTGGQLVRKQFSLEAVGKIMRDRLYQINSDMNPVI